MDTNEAETRVDPTFRGVVTDLWVADERTGSPAARESVEAVADRGLRGDRYFRPADAEGPGVEVTLGEREALDAAARDYDVSLPAGAHRRNVVTTAHSPPSCGRESPARSAARWSGAAHPIRRRIVRN